MVIRLLPDALLRSKLTELSVLLGDEMQQECVAGWRREFGEERNWRDGDAAGWRKAAVSVGTQAFALSAGLGRRRHQRQTST